MKWGFTSYCSAPDWANEDGIHHICNDREFIELLGSLPEFGEWNITKGLRANQHPEGTWESEVILFPGQELEFKWVLFANGMVKWEDRSNRYIITPQRDTVYTAIWNGNMEISEIKSTFGGSVLRHRKKDFHASPCNCNKAVLGAIGGRTSETSVVDENLSQTSVFTYSAMPSPSQSSSYKSSLSSSQSLVNHDEASDIVDEDDLEDSSKTSIHNQLAHERQSLKNTSSLLAEIRSNKQKETAKYGSIINVVFDLLILFSFIFSLIIIFSLVFSHNDQ